MMGDPGGDLRALAISTVGELTDRDVDRARTNGTVELDNGTHIPLIGSGVMLTAKVPVDKDGMYHFAAVEQGQSVRLSEDYFIEAREDQAPNVHIVHPRSDAKVSPIEEVTIEVNADDDFALDGMELHYSVNGAPEKTVSLLPNKGVKTASGKTMISLEDYKLQAGDVVSVYATAKDARNTARTDIMFIETQPFEKNYTQSLQVMVAAVVVAAVPAGSIRIRFRSAKRKLSRPPGMRSVADLRIKSALPRTPGSWPKCRPS